MVDLLEVSTIYTQLSLELSQTDLWILGHVICKRPYSYTDPLGLIDSSGKSHSGSIVVIFHLP